MNILTFDIEEWFHLLNYKYSKTETDWNHYPARISANVDNILDTLQKYDRKATFFILGWIAEKYPSLVKKIASRGYEIGCHTGYHKMIHEMTPESFRNDILRSIIIIEDVSGQKVRSFRAPGFSLKTRQKWAFEILAESGIEIDSSMFPSFFSLDYRPSFPESKPFLLKYNGLALKELPMSFRNFPGFHVVFSGGGYFRLCPYPLLSRWTKQSPYLMSYLHPRDLDATQPMLKGLSMIRKFRSYTGIKGAQAKFERWLGDFEFTDVSTANEMIDWDHAKVLAL